MEIRLQKFLAEAGVASRRKAEELIVMGKVQVNGKVITELGTKIDTQNDIILYQNKKVEIKQNFIYIMLHKPEGYVTTVKDQFQRPTVMDLLGDVTERVYPVGRLDYDTSGLLLLTNDGDLTYHLTHPKHHIEKTYEAKLFGIPSEHNIIQFRRGIVIDGKKTEPAKLEILQKEKKYTTVRIVIQEGRNRQVRKMCQAIKHPVAQLKRIGTGTLFLKDLKKGNYRYLTQKEISYLKSL
ncbi:pseudouridine synthase [Clostridium sp. MD294]|uniref:pseudouridine synthase n=1 Tax=Clostridium sp. MD294 TaxID=97138 RepID=UPI0002C9E6B6|nr:pseudouridine synthase [Clostridium sp. MD294]NDO45593.1 rRNA pseudouridine synthase [Clostridium sp. MD294]USF30753.1 Ribosomal large subunit pseudouridine synthase B [Clostridium sp. MD294]